MDKKTFFTGCIMASLVQTSLAQKETRFLLDTVDSGDGWWPCLFYELNRNTDITVAEKAKWASLDEDESYWCTGVGPFSNDANKFLITQWESTVHPILIRRHFTLTGAEQTTPITLVPMGAARLRISAFPREKQ